MERPPEGGTGTIQWDDVFPEAGLLGGPNEVSKKFSAPSNSASSSSRKMVKSKIIIFISLYQFHPVSISVLLSMLRLECSTAARWCTLKMMKPRIMCWQKSMRLVRANPPEREGFVPRGSKVQGPPVLNRTRQASPDFKEEHEAPTLLQSPGVAGSTAHRLCLVAFSKKC